MHGVRARIAGALGHLLRLDHPYDLRVLGVGLGVQDMDARRAEARHHQIAPLHMGMRRVGTQARRAGVPAEVMQLVAEFAHRRRADDRRVGCRVWVDIDHGQGIRRFPVGIKGRHVSERFGRRFHRHAGRGIKARIGLPGRHEASPHGLANVQGRCALEPSGSFCALRLTSIAALCGFKHCLDAAFGQPVRPLQCNAAGCARLVVCICFMHEACPILNAPSWSGQLL